jgi:hypothetical protein
MKTLAIALAGLSLAATAQPAAAAVVNTLPGGVAQVMPDLGWSAFTAGPVTFGDLTYSSTTSWSVLGWSYGYGFSANGFWSGFPMAGVNTDSGTMTFDLAHPVAGILADINWANSGQLVTMAAYDSGNNLLESFVFNADWTNQVNPGYWGFQRGQADIARFTLSNGYVGARDFTTVGGAVPEPAAWALMLMGFGLVGASVRGRRMVAAAA